MPLRAKIEGQDITSIFMTDEAWSAVRGRDVQMSCCNARGYGRTSSRGVRHFVHARGAQCGAAGETADHLTLKALAAAAGVAAGWQAEVEAAGEDWRADVLMTRRAARVAVEIQWSAQTMQETRARQARYTAAGVRACWLMRVPPRPDDYHGGDWRRLSAQEKSAHLHDHDTPVFVVEADTTRPSGYAVWVGGSDHDAAVFVSDLLSGRLTFCSHTCFQVTATVHGYDCGGCGRTLAYAVVCENGVAESGCGRRFGQMFLAYETTGFDCGWEGFLHDGGELLEAAAGVARDAGLALARHWVSAGPRTGLLRVIEISCPQCRHTWDLDPHDPPPVAPAQLGSVTVPVALSGPHWCPAQMTGACRAACRPGRPDSPILGRVGPGPFEASVSVTVSQDPRELIDRMFGRGM